VVLLIDDVVLEIMTLSVQEVPSPRDHINLLMFSGRWKNSYTGWLSYLDVFCYKRAPRGNGVEPSYNFFPLALGQFFWQWGVFNAFSLCSGKA
jgi:hypothetical protein